MERNAGPQFRRFSAKTAALADSKPVGFTVGFADGRSLRALDRLDWPTLRLLSHVLLSDEFLQDHRILPVFVPARSKLVGIELPESNHRYGQVVDRDNHSIRPSILELNT